MQDPLIIRATFYPPKDFPYGWVCLNIDTNNARISFDINTLLNTNPKDIENYRQNLLATEKSLAQSIEVVRVALAALPAESMV